METLITTLSEREGALDAAELATDARVAAAEARISAALAALTEAEQRLQEAQALAAERQGALHEAEKRLAEQARQREKQLAAQLAGWRGRAARLEVERDSLRHERDLVLGSTFWRLTAPARRLVNKTPPGLRRQARRCLTVMYWILTPHRTSRRIAYYRSRAAEAAVATIASPPAVRPEPDRTASSPGPPRVPIEHGKALYLKRCELSAFRARTGHVIQFPVAKTPFFSVIVCAYNKFSYNIHVLELLEHAACYTTSKLGIDIEVVFINDGSGDETARIDHYVKGIVFRSVSPNIGFLRACNFGAASASGSYLVFLNNDVEFSPDVFVRLHAAVERDKAEVACFGGAILQFDGTIQDLGSGIWRDGAAQGYFRNEPPTRYAFVYPRDVDYVAGCFFCISAAEFRAFGGFDERYSPGYYEEADLALRLWKTGRRSRVYPDIRIYHLEYGTFSSEATPRASIELMVKNRPAFVEQHRDLLDQRPELRPNVSYPVRYDARRPRVLFIEQTIPSVKMGSGFGRSETILRSLLEFTDVDIFSCRREPYMIVPEDFDYIEITFGPSAESLYTLLERKHYDMVYICRTLILARYDGVLSAWKRKHRGVVVCDTEAVAAIRDLSQRTGAESYREITTSAEFANALRAEFRGADAADSFVAVNEFEAGIVRQHCSSPVYVVGHYFLPKPAHDSLSLRRGLFFFGAIHGAETPNYDSLVWFLNCVWPKIRKARPAETLLIAGLVRPEVSLAPLMREGVIHLGPVDDPGKEFARTRVFIAPTRFAAGIPFKVQEALSYGVPAVTSLLIAEQLAYTGECTDVLCAATVNDSGTAFAEACLRLLTDDALWTEKHRAALAYTERCCAPSRLHRATEELLCDLLPSSAAAASADGSRPEVRAINLDEWRSEIVLGKDGAVALDQSIGIFVHLFYPDLAEEVAGYLAHIDLPKKIYVSIASEEGCAAVSKVFERYGLAAISEFAAVPNCGADIAPLVVKFGDRLSQHEICLKIHGNKLLNAPAKFGEYWRRHLYAELLGDPDRVRVIVATLLAQPKLGVLVPHHFLRNTNRPSVGPNFDKMHKVLSKIDVDLLPDQHVEFPNGSMFWFRSEALAGLPALGFDWPDFEQGADPANGSLAQGVEQCLLFFCVHAGRRWGFLPGRTGGSAILRDEAIRLVRESGAFDEEYYLATYEDVAAAGVDPIEHWVDFGWREGRNPSAPEYPDFTGPDLAAGNHAKSPPPVADRSIPSSSGSPSGQRAVRPSLDVAPLTTSAALEQYLEVAPLSNSAPLAPRFIFGPFPENLMQAYFAEYTALSVGCYSLSNAGVTSHGLLVRDGALLVCDQLSLSEAAISEAGRYGSIRAKDRYSRLLDGPTVALAGPGHLIYGHWLADFLPKLYLLHRIGLDPCKSEYIIPGNTPDFALSWLRLLGISDSQIIRFDTYNEVVGVRRLIVPTMLRSNGRTHPLFRSAIEYLLSLIPGGKNCRIAERGAGRNLFVARGAPGLEARKLLNRRAIEQLAADAGFEVVRPERFSLTEQLAMFAEASCIVGEYGSGLHGSLFASAGTMVCALRAAARHPGFLQSGLCQAMDQKIGYVFGAACEDDDFAQQFSISEEDFRSALQLMESNGGFG
jgi:O-antigen biosynthesis protein